MDDDLALFDYDLPPECIASAPHERRDASRLLVVSRSSGSVMHRHMTDLPELLEAGDLLVLNDTRVIPARLFGLRDKTGGKWEGLFLSLTAEGNWRLLCQTRGTLLHGETISVRPAHAVRSASRTGQIAHQENLTLETIGAEGEGVWHFRPRSLKAEANSPFSSHDLKNETSEINPPSFAVPQPTVELLERFGTVPLPHYVGRKLAEESDWSRYQTTYARVAGAIAAPTAGLHFTPELLARCRERGIEQAFVTLHVGIGTFRPVSVERLSEHQMHSEWCAISEETAAAVQRTKSQGGRIVAVGTTTLRTLESSIVGGNVAAGSQETRLFIRPPYEFQAIDILLTNFHLPKSTLLVLISALLGRERTLAIYREAIEHGYRFFSYGDAMLILP